MKKRIFSMFLCLCMVFTMVSTMVPTASAANEFPLMDEQITAKIKDYISTVEAWKGNGKAYWNAGYNTEKLKEAVNQKEYTIGLTQSHCAGGAQHNINGQGCNSNHFNGVDIAGRQCSGFAAYMEYVIFQTTDSWKEYKAYDVGNEYNFRPGDLVRYDGHSAIVYKIEGSDVYFIECNWRKWGGYGDDSDYCIIRWNRSIKQGDLRAAINAGGETYVVRPPASLRVDSTTTPPSAPTNITGTLTSTVSHWQAKISWDAVSGAESYEIQYRMNWGLWSPSITVKSQTSYIYPLLTMYASYDFRVKAVNAGGASGWGYCTPEKPSVVPTPATPKNVSAIWASLGNTSVRVSWSTVSGAESYQVQYKAKGDSLWCSSGAIKSTSCTVPVSNTDDSYDIRVKAVNTAGSSDWAECSLLAPKKIVSVLQEKAQPPITVNAPTGVSGVWTSTGPNWQARISWNAVSGATRYEVQYKTPKTGNTWKTDSDYSSGTFYISTGLGDYNSYDYRIRAVNADGVSGWTEYTLVKPASTQEGTSSQTTSLSTSTPPSAPSGVTGAWTSTGPNWQARISWNAVSGATQYEVQYRTPKTGNVWKTDSDYSSGTSYISTGLGDYNSYGYRVRAVNADGVSGWTEYTLVKTTVAPEPTPSQTTPVSTPTPPSAPSGVTGAWTSTGSNWQARISWNAVSGATRYEVQYRTPSTGNEWRADPDYSSGTSYISRGLGNYNSYDYRVRAINAEGASGWTEYTLVKTVSTPESAPAATASAAPTNVSGSWTSRGPNWQARISWNAVSGATRYEVQYRTPSTGNEWRADPDYSSGTSYISRGLGNYNSYDYRVRAVNASGSSGWTEYTLYK